MHCGALLDSLEVLDGQRNILECAECAILRVVVLEFPRLVRCIEWLLMACGGGERRRIIVFVTLDLVLRAFSSRRHGAGTSSRRLVLARLKQFASGRRCVSAPPRAAQLARLRALSAPSAGAGRDVLGRWGGRRGTVDPLIHVLKSTRSISEMCGQRTTHPCMDRTSVETIAHGNIVGHIKDWPQACP